MCFKLCICADISLLIFIDNNFCMNCYVHNAPSVGLCELLNCYFRPADWRWPNVEPMSEKND